MGYSAEVVKRARARLAEAKADRESENQQHLAQAYEKLPRLREIDRQLRMTMAMAAQAAFSQGGDVQAMMNEAKEKNLSLQNERRLLVNQHFEEGYLDDSPICDHCGGSGYIGTNMCECLRELCRQEQKKELSVLTGGKEHFNQFRLDYYPDRLDPKYGASPPADHGAEFPDRPPLRQLFQPRIGQSAVCGWYGLGQDLPVCLRGQNRGRPWLLRGL